MYGVENKYAQIVGGAHRFADMSNVKIGALVATHPKLKLLERGIDHYRSDNKQE